MVGTTALIIMGIAQAGSAIAKAKIESNAAKAATKAQTDSASQAMAMNQRLWGQQQQNAQPYQQMGGQASTTLNALMLPPGAPGAYNPNKPPVYTQPGPNMLTPFSPGISGPMPLSPTPGPMTRQPQLPDPMRTGGVTPRMASGQPLNPYAMTA